MSGPEIGSLREQVQLQTPQETDDGSGGVTLTWMGVASVWAAIDPLSQRESVVADHLDGIVTHRVQLRFRDDTRGGWRIIAGARTLRVLATRDPDGRRRFLDCLSEEEGR